MNRKQAVAAIKGILDAVDDRALPQGEIRDEGDGKTLLWFENLSCGYYLGSAKNGWGDRIPSHYHTQAAERALELEAVYRADKKFFANGDKAASA